MYNEFDTIMVNYSVVSNSSGGWDVKKD